MWLNHRKKDERKNVIFIIGGSIEFDWNAFCGLLFHNDGVCVCDCVTSMPVVMIRIV